MTIRMPTRAELLQWAPNAQKDYLDAFLDLEGTLEKAGILHHPLILCHFLGQVGAETDGLRIKRENMNYTSVQRIRQVWPARARRTPQAQLEKLVRNPVGLSDWAYGGRMGNKKGTTDGFDFRGAGPMQTTGKHATMKYCRRCQIPFHPGVLDDARTLWLFAIEEWATTGCNSRALENDILGISKIINTGSATSGVMPNGLNHRKRWFKRAWRLWGDLKKEHIPEVSDVTVEKLRERGSETVSTSDLLKTGAIGGGVVSGIAGGASESGIVETVPQIPPQEVIDQIQKGTESMDTVSGFVQSLKGFFVLLTTNLWVAGIACACIGAYAAYYITKRRLLDARLAENTSRLHEIDPVDDSLVLDPEDAVIPRG